MMRSRSVAVEALSPRCALVCEGPERSASLCICARARHILHTNPRDKDDPQVQVQVVHSFGPTLRCVSGLVKVFGHSVKDLEALPRISEAAYYPGRTCHFLSWLKLKRGRGNEELLPCSA